MSTPVCAECGETNINPFNDDPRYCFDCGFWMEKVAVAGAPHIVRSNGLHYSIGAEGGSYPGNYGRRYVVQFNDGRQVLTSNLWHQGRIPERFRSRLPDNGTIREERAA